MFIHHLIKVYLLAHPTIFFINSYQIFNGFNSCVNIFFFFFINRCQNSKTNWKKHKLRLRLKGLLARRQSGAALHRCRARREEGTPATSSGQNENWRAPWYRWRWGLYDDFMDCPPTFYTLGNTRIILLPVMVKFVAFKGENLTLVKVFYKLLSIKIQLRPVYNR